MRKVKDLEFVSELFKLNEYASIAEDGIVAGDFNGFLDSGSYTLNALMSGSIYGGFPLGKISALAGPSKVGKSFFCLSTMKLLLDKDPKAIIILFETESALTKDVLINFGIDVSRVVVLPVDTVQRFRHQCMKFLNNYDKQPKADRRPILIILDSLGMLSTEKEIGDISDGKDTRDMTRAQLIKGSFRALTLKLGKLGIPFVLTNHTYMTQGLFAQTVQGGGTGLEYAASTVVFLSKKKDKVGSDVVGNIIHCKLDKGRLTKENSLIDTAIRYDTGLQRWYGMIDLAIEAGIWQKSGTRIELQDGSKIYAKNIMEEVDRFFTDDIMSKIDKYCERKFKYGNAVQEEIDGESSTNTDDDSEDNIIE